MANKQFIQTPDAPAAIGTYSQAIRAGDTIYLSGQIGLDPSPCKWWKASTSRFTAYFRICAPWLLLQTAT